jgi:Zn-dependent M28 family amino/carboxypeptidase
MKKLNCILFSLSIVIAISANAQNKVPPSENLKMYDIVKAVSADRLEKDIRILAGFGTRNTMSDTVSSTRGIGAARRWIKSEFEVISKACDNCLEVYCLKNLVKPDGRRIKMDTWVVNVIAIQRGTKNPNSYVIMSGDIDSRNSDPSDPDGDAPGANDNASGMAGTIEAARVLSKYSFENSVVYVGLSGEEQGLYGGQHMAKVAKEEGWDIMGVLNNDMIGNIEGVDGVIENSTFRVFSEPTPVTETDKQRGSRRYYGGEVDGVSRQLARYVHRMTNQYIDNLDAKMIYRLDRFGRGGHHKPFNDQGFPGIRIMETHENYNRQHQNIRTENGIAYGDVIEGVNFDYAAKLTAVNAITLAGLAWGPTPPKSVKIGGAVQASAKLVWDKSENAVGYKVHWRDTTSPQWEQSKYIGNVSEYTFEKLVIDNYLFGISAVSASGDESVVVFPSEVIR